MDAFDKLAKLAGASVESVGEGLPRTRAEAKSLGVTRYFSGEPCRRGHFSERTTYGGACVKCLRQYEASPKMQSAGLQYKKTPNFAESMRQRARIKKGDDILFAIGQAELYARMGRAPADIVHQCPDPQRSKLQALVDRIKADPQAGKAVIGLLRTMRELREAELAEMRHAAPDPV